MQERARHALLNAAIAGLALALLALVYGVATRVAQPDAALASSSSSAGPASEPFVPGASEAADTLDIPQVEVLNATGIDGLAGQARSFLVDAGMDVLATGNYAGSPASRSRVLSRTGDLALARRVAHTLGIRDAQVASEPQPDLRLDVSVVLGADYRALRPFLPDSSGR